MSGDQVETRGRIPMIDHQRENALDVLHGAEESAGMRRLAAVVFAIGLVVSAVALQQTWRRPILEAHSFRQTQTAATAYWLGEGGPFFAYETPALGAPWAVPFELPVYQAIVAGVNQLGVHLDGAGRLVSWLFFLLTLWQLHSIVRKLGGSRHLGLLLCGLILLSPHYVFWSRAFMIESTALFFSMAFVSMAVSHVKTPRVWTGVAMAVLATLAGLVKVTTFVAFGVAGGMVVLCDLVQLGHWKDARRWTLRYAPVALAGIIAMFVVSLWVDYVDALKLAHPFGRNLTSENLRPWVYGTKAQRWDPTFWREVVFGRTLAEVLGGPARLWALLVAALVFGRAAVAWAIVLLVLYMIPFAVFSNLHWIHNYYQYANALFAICVVGVVAWHARAGWRRWIAIALIGFVVTGEIVRLVNVEWPQMRAKQHRSDTIRLSRRLTDLPAEGVLLVFGYDWSPELAYYARHRAITVPAWTSREQLESLRAQPLVHSGGLPIVAVVECPHRLRQNPVLAPIMDAIMAEQTRGKQSYQMEACILWR